MPKRVEARLRRQRGAPTFRQYPALGAVARSFLRIEMVQPASLRFEMPQRDMRRVQNLEPAGPQFQRQIDVAMRDRQAGGVEAAMCEECLTPHSKERAVDGADRARHMPAPAGSGVRLRLIEPVMDREPLPVEQDAGMLHAPVGIEETRADCADLGA